MATWYFKAGGDNNWSTLANWWSNSDGTGSNPTDNAPWTADNSYKADDLSLVTEETTYPNIDVYIGYGFTITGVCDIPNVTADGNWVGGVAIYGGTFTGVWLASYASILGGTFTGASFFNGGYIYGGTFTGASFVNSGFAFIYRGTFTGSGFMNSVFGYIYGGTFTGSGFTNGNFRSSIFGGIFTGSGFNNNSDGEIRGGIFTGASFTANGTIYSGIWWLSGNIKVSGLNLKASGDPSPHASFTVIQTSSDVLGGGLL